MTAPNNEPLLSEEQRRRLTVYAKNASPITIEDDDVLASLSEISRLGALADDYAALLHDHLHEGSPLIERLVAAEREAIVDMIGKYRTSRGVSYINTGLVAAILARGPVLPPLPPARYAEENEALKGVLRRLLEGPRGKLAVPTSAIDDARALLGEAKRAGG